jgi:hypothetical protein
MSISRKHAIIIGAMKAGTSSLFYYLSEHPHICPSKPKEPQFFSTPQLRNQGLRGYLKYWNFGEDHEVLLEASTNYTKYPAFSGAPSAIYDSKMQPYLIYIIRNPFQRIVSHYNHSIKRGRKCQILDPHLMHVSDYYFQLAQYKEKFPKMNIMLIDFDEFVDEPQVIINKVFEFLGLDSYSGNFEKVHNKTAKNGFLAELFKKNTLPLKKTLNSDEYETIFNFLASNMKLLSLEYGVNVKKWGF